MRIWTGRAGSGKTTAILREIAALSERGEGRQILLVPELNSHLMERRLAAATHNHGARTAEVLTFSRLADRVFSEVGGLAQQMLTPAGQLLTLQEAARRVQRGLSAWKGLADKPELLQEALRLIDEATEQVVGETVVSLRVLNAFPLGFRHFYTKKPVATIDDMKHLRMRVPNIPLYINFAKECGISGQPMPFAEVTGALDQGVIDGGDSPLSDIVSIKMYETTPEITLTGHLLVIHSLYINEKFYQSLPEQDRKWIDEAAKRSADYVWDLVEKVDADAVKTITEAGGHVSEPSPELHKFMQDAGKRSWKLFYDTVPNAKEILDSADSYRQAK